MPKIGQGPSNVAGGNVGANALEKTTSKPDAKREQDLLKRLVGMLQKMMMQQGQGAGGGGAPQKAGDTQGAGASGLTLEDLMKKLLEELEKKGMQKTPELQNLVQQAGAMLQQGGGAAQATPSVGGGGGTSMGGGGGS